MTLALSTSRATAVQGNVKGWPLRRGLACTGDCGCKSYPSHVYELDHQSLSKSYLTTHEPG